MAGQFSFNFSGDDIEVGGDGANEMPGVRAQDRVPEVEVIPARVHKLEELLSTLPSKISYSTLTLESPRGRTAIIPRRELFDIRLQLMAEDDGALNEATAAALGDDDIKTAVYEGGFKTWECSLDLARLLMDRGPRKDIDDLCRVDHVIELGCGTALPTLILFQYALRESLSLAFTLTDYNASVLRLVTLPNLLLSWAMLHSPHLFIPDSSSPPASPSPSPSSLSTLTPSPIPTHGDLPLPPSLLSSFLSTLSSLPLSLTLLSGSWTSPSPPFLSLIPSLSSSSSTSSSGGAMATLVLASETIYSPASLTAFTRVLVAILRRVRMGKAMIAAKKLYFGTGGSVDAFKEACAELGAVGYEVENYGGDLGGEGSGGGKGGGGGGVRRCLLEVQMM